MTRRAVTWTEVAERLAASRNYWLTTNGRDGAPHAAPVWGAVVDSVLYLYSERRTAKAKNLAADPRSVVHLESGDDVVIVHGVLADVGAPSDVPDVVAALDEKYAEPGDAGYLPSGDPDFHVVYALHPRLALMWRLDDYDGSQQRWAAGEPAGTLG